MHLRACHVPIHVRAANKPKKDPPHNAAASRLASTRHKPRKTERNPRRCKQQLGAHNPPQCTSLTPSQGTRAATCTESHSPNTGSNIGRSIHSRHPTHNWPLPASNHIRTRLRQDKTAPSRSKHQPRPGPTNATPCRTPCSHRSRPTQHQPNPPTHQNNTAPTARRNCHTFAIACCRAWYHTTRPVDGV